MNQLIFRGLCFISVLIAWIVTMVETTHLIQSPSTATLLLTLALILMVWEFGLHMALTYGRKHSEESRRCYVKRKIDGN